MKIFSILAGWFEPREDPRMREADASRWLRDPLAHPAIEAMSQREVADLPMARFRRDRLGACGCP